LEEAVGASGEVSLHMIQVIHRKQQDFTLLNSLNAKETPIVCLETILLELYFMRFSILVVDLGRTVNY